MKDFLTSIKEKVLLYDGSKGVMLQRMGLKGSEAAESWNISKPDEVKSVYSAYKQAGSDVIQTNTFPGNGIQLGAHKLGDKVYELNHTGVKLAKEIAGGERLVAASAGPTGLFFQPAGEMTFDQAYGIFSEQLKAIEDAGADVVNFETFTDLAEIRAAIIAAKEKTKLPVIASVTFNKGSRTMSGNPAEVCAIVCQSLGASVVGANCSGGPDSLLEPIKKMYSVATVPLAAKPNAGMPEIVDGKTVFVQNPEKFSAYTRAFVENGVRLIGGCCGTTPEFIAAIGKELDGIVPPDVQAKKNFLIASQYEFVDMSASGKLSSKELRLYDKGLLAALKDGDFDEITDMVQDFEDDDIDYLTIDFGNMGPGFDVWGFASEFAMSAKKPVILKSESMEMLEKFLRYYPGRAGVVLTDAVKNALPQLQRYGILPVDIGFKPVV